MNGTSASRSRSISPVTTSQARAGEGPVPGGVAYFGYGELGVAGLRTLISLRSTGRGRHDPGQPQRAWSRQGAGSRGAVRPVPLLVQPPRSSVEPFAGVLRNLSPDLILMWWSSMLLPPPVLTIPAKGAVNVHGGLLPSYRGGHVTQWAIINGEREFGVTLHYVDDGVDTGPVIAERRFALDDTDDAQSVAGKLREAGSELLTTWWPRLIDGTAPRIPQDESRAKYWPLRTPEEGRVTWEMSAPAICRLVRALSADAAPGGPMSTCVDAESDCVALP